MTPVNDGLDFPPVDRSETSPPDRSEAWSEPQSGPQHTGPVRWPVWLAMPLIFGVFVAGAVWSFREQTALARSAGFHVPELLPLVIDGFAAAMAAVAWAASLDGRAAVMARLGIAVGIACSVGTNAAWAWERSGADRLTVVLAGGVPVLAMLAFEAVLAEVRRQVQRRRGLPQPDPVPLPRFLAVLLSPLRTPRMWRRLALDLTDPRRQFEAVHAALGDRPANPPMDRLEHDPEDQSADRSEPAVDDVAGPVGHTEPDRSETNATVTPINRPRPRPTASARPRRTGPKTGRLADHGPTAIEDAEAVLDRYGDTVPTRSQLSADTGWGSPKAGNALKALPAVRAARRERSTTTQSDQSDRSDPDDEESEVVFA